MQALDLDGKPLSISAQFVFRIADSFSASFKTDNLNKFLYNQGKSALRAVAVKYPYHLKNQSSPGDCLSRQSLTIDQHLVDVFQKSVDFIGVKIESFQLTSVDLQKDNN
ncbi:MAG TPA: SPFH domain-containing protein [Parachlamydiaceae bacterium]|nr:SPFH domain-containing protein [Parachlamydiaceae bacterium]